MSIDRVVFSRSPSTPLYTLYPSTFVNSFFLSFPSMERFLRVLPAPVADPVHILRKAYDERTEVQRSEMCACVMFDLAVEGKSSCTPFREEISNLPRVGQSAPQKGPKNEAGT